jgi:transcriptional activator SPT7
MARKKRKLEEEKEENGVGDPGFAKSLGKPIGKLKLDVPSQKEQQPVAEPEKDDGSAVGMISPESITAS